MHDVCIVGAGPAGLSAAVVLGRCGHDVVVFDSGEPRNAVSRGLHAYLSRDGIHPMLLRKIGRFEAEKYPTVRFIEAEIVRAERVRAGFAVETTDGRIDQARILLLATGRIDVLPDKPGFRAYYGRGVYHCPICDGWEHRNEALVAYGDCRDVIALAAALRTWSAHVTLCSSTPDLVTARDREELDRKGVQVALAPVVGLTGTDERLTGVELKDGTIIHCGALFFTSDVPQKSPLAQNLGCKLDRGGSVVCLQHAATGVPGLYVAGNVRGGIHLAIMAAAEGAEAAVAIHEALANSTATGPNGS
jgi:thioredoxin reductase